MIRSYDFLCGLFVVVALTLASFFLVLGAADERKCKTCDESCCPKKNNCSCLHTDICSCRPETANTPEK